MGKKKYKIQLKNFFKKDKKELGLSILAVKNLVKLAKEAGLSKSQLIKELAKGTIVLVFKPDNLSTTTPTIRNEHSLELPQNSNQSEQITSDSWEELQQQCREQANTINQLQIQLIQQDKITTALKQKLQEQQKSIHKKPKNENNSKQQLEQQNLIINNLKTELARQTEKCNFLTNQLENKQNLITRLQEQIIATKTNDTINSLKQELAQKNHLINELIQANANLTSLARIGEHQLNKWRDLV
jgi:chromosome segregation ATPase